MAVQGTLWSLASTRIDRDSHAVCIVPGPPRHVTWHRGKPDDKALLSRATGYDLSIKVRIDPRVDPSGNSHSQIRRDFQALPRFELRTRQAPREHAGTEGRSHHLFFVTHERALDKVELKKVSAFEAGLQAFAKTNYKAQMDGLNANPVLNPENEAILKKISEEFAVTGTY
jgi:hypothetical protein